MLIASKATITATIAAHNNLLLLSLFFSAIFFAPTIKTPILTQQMQKWNFFKNPGNSTPLVVYIKTHKRESNN